MDADRVGHSGTVQRCLRETLSTAIDALAVGKSVARGGRNGAPVVRVPEVEVSVVKYVHVTNESIVDVNHRNEVAAAAEPGEERLAPSQREPAYAKADPKSPASAKPADKSRSVNRRAKERPWAPTP